VLTNACIESFAIHARSLVCFFNGEDGSDAADYATNYAPFPEGRIPKRLTAKLNQQTAHITERRFNTVEEKLNGHDIRELRELVDAEVARFLDHMQPHYRALWDTKNRHLRHYG
jgi:hypothetical protein